LRSVSREHIVEFESMHHGLNTMRIDRGELIDQCDDTRELLREGLDLGFVHRQSSEGSDAQDVMFADCHSQILSQSRVRCMAERSVR
jgi:hypothetical protein